jgi:perosamine synthetase
MAFDAGGLSKRVLAVLGDTDQSHHLHEPLFQGNEWEYVRDTIDSGWVSSVGSYVDGFEKKLAEICDVGHVIAVGNGTAALHICLLLAGVKPGEEVLIPTLTFVATANAVAYCGATPHFCDSAELTLGLDPKKLSEYLEAIGELVNGECRNKETGKRIAAVMPMHAFGHPVELDELSEVCDRWGISLIEDAAEAVGSRYKSRHVGQHGLVSGVSFNGNKIVTTGGGGAILTNDPKLAAAAKHLTTTAKIPHKWAFDHDQIAYNYRMPNLNAALGVAQLESLPTYLAAKRRLADRYKRAFTDASGARLFQDAPFVESNYWLMTILVDDPSGKSRDAFLEDLHGRKIFARPAWSNLHTQVMFRDCPKMDLGNAEQLQNRIVNLPSSVFLGLANDD